MLGRAAHLHHELIDRRRREHDLGQIFGSRAQGLRGSLRGRGVGEVRLVVCACVDKAGITPAKRISQCSALPPMRSHMDTAEIRSSAVRSPRF